MPTWALIAACAYAVLWIVSWLLILLSIAVHEPQFRHVRWYDIAFIPITFVAYQIDEWKMAKKLEWRKKIDARRRI